MPLVRSRRLALACLVASLVTPSLPRSAIAIWSLNPSSPLPVCSAIKQQQFPSACTDGASGMIVVWEDHRDSLATSSDIYAQRVTSEGNVAAGWPVNGFAVCKLAGAQTVPMLVSDDAGGAIVTWRDLRATPPAIYAQHILGTGAVDPAWPTNGLLVCSAANSRNYAAIVSDGAGGAILAWQDNRDSLSGAFDLFAHHVLASGAVDPAWPANGLLVCSTVGFKYFYNTLVADGSGGALLAWGDYRSGTSWDMYASHVLATGTVDAAVPANGTPVCTLAGDQIYPALSTDGASGAYLAWTDYRLSPGDPRIYATRIKHNGTVYLTWPANGIEVCGGPASFQYLPVIAWDGATGAIVAWDDYRSSTMGQVFAQHVLSSASVDAGWPANAVQISSTSLNNNVEVVTPDGAGGAFVTWETYPTSGSFFPDYLSAGHLLSTGVTDPTWPSDGRPFDTATGAQVLSQIVPDGAGGIDIAWQHGHPLAAFNDDIDGTRIAYNGLIAPEPTMESIADVPDDQGGRVTVRWNASWTDTLPTLPVSSYTLWRRLTGTAAQQALARGARVLDSRASEAPANPATAPTRETLRVSSEAGVPIYWEFEVTVPASAFTGYAYEVATDADSSTSGIPWEDFMVTAYLKSGAPFYSSGLDSGYSVDNIPPAMPQPFTVTYATGTAFLHWGPNSEPDLAGYRLYRGWVPNFTPGPANLVVAQPDTGYTDVAGAPYFYKLSAVDIHGNQSPYAQVLATGTTGVPVARAFVFALSPVWPNPSRGDRLTVQFSLPDLAPARLELFDLGGRRVSTREVGALGAGAHAMDLSAGRTFAPGLYIVRLTQHGLARTVRVAVLE